MLDTLRKKFIVTNMILVGIVLVIVFVTICTNIYAIQKEEVEKTLHAPFAGGNRYEAEMGVLTSIVVIVDHKGKFAETYLNGAILDRDTLKLAVSKVMNGTETKGKLGRENLYFEKSQLLNSMTAIVFVDSHRLELVMARTISVSVIALLLAMIIVYFISRFVAGIAIEPVEKSWEQQKQFIADASHELKTPLTVILANSDILKHRKSSTIGDEEKWIDSTMQEATHMKSLVDDMLYLAKNDSGHIVEEKSQFNLSRLVSGDILQLEPLAYEKGMTIEDSIEPDIQITANERDIRQLVHILIDNAIKYTEIKDSYKNSRYIQYSNCPWTGDNFIEVSLYKEKKNTIVLSVKNQGEIIDGDKLQHLFDRFYRTDTARAKEGVGGTGLGLAIAKAIVEKNNGTIEVNSGIDCGPKEMQGTGFTIRFDNN